MLKNILFLVIICAFCQLTVAQREMSCFRTSPIQIDGLLNDSVWNSNQFMTDFTQISPNAGATASNKTIVKTAYDDYAIYVGAHCYIQNSNISNVLCQRDNFNSNIDYFSVMLDTYHDQLNGFVFSISSEGVQYDAKIYSGDYNSKLDMIWYGEVSHSDSGWTVELMIPYSAIRFPKNQSQIWGINFTRYDSYIREESSWNIINPDLQNIVAQAGILKNINHISPPIRLFFSPYFSTYAEQNTNENNDDLKLRISGGMDIKYGLNEAFTLDMTLIPDFGQVVTDNVVLNLSPFEVFYNENRSFFNEGTELFNKSGIFYSRRVGGVPINRWKANSELQANEEIIENPSNSQLINASKFSGRNKKGLGIGIFNGICSSEKAVLRDSLTNITRLVETSPLTNYNMLVLDQNLKNNSSITFSNTNVWRSGNTYDANVSALNLKINSQSNKYYISGNSAVSMKISNLNSNIGHNYSLEMGKQRGNFTYSFNYLELSDQYDPNDLGFLFNNNKRTITSEISYNIYQPFWILNKLRTSISNQYDRLYNPNVFTGSSYSLNVIATNRSFHSFGFNYNGSYTENKDYFEPRTIGYFFNYPRYDGTNIWFSSNYQKNFALDIRTSFVKYNQTDWVNYSYSISPRIRIGNKLFLIYRFENDINLNQLGYAIPFIPLTTNYDEIIFGQRNLNTMNNVMDFDFTLNKKSGFNFRLRHYWSQVEYLNFFELLLDGSLYPIEIQSENQSGTSFYNTNFNVFSIDFSYRWIFSPASEISVLWKNNIFTSNSNINQQYLLNLQNTLNADQLNSFSIRIIYLIDYLTIKKNVFN